MLHSYIQTELFPMLFIQYPHAVCVPSAIPSLSFQFFLWEKPHVQNIQGWCVCSAFQNKGEVQEKEVKKFDGTGYDKDLVEALERDIISQNPNIKWYAFTFVGCICIQKTVT